MPGLRLVVVDLPASGTDRHGVAHLIAEHRADVAVVHGAPSLLRWRSHCAAIAREAGLVVVGGGRTGGGNLLLSGLGVDVDAVREVAFTAGVRPPGATVAALRLLGSPFVLAGARLQQPNQRAELQSVVDAIALDDPPAVLALRGAADSTDSTAGFVVDDGLTVIDSHTITGGVRVDLRLEQ